MKPTTRRPILLAASLATLLLGTGVGLLALPQPADAFCGFYVAGADASLYNNATVVVLMRDGTRTVLSMQNDYQGPPEDFALVIPVPVVLGENDVKTLPKEIFGRVDKLAAPRLVEYWEKDPCEPEPDYKMMADGSGMPIPAPTSGASAAELGVKIEAQFEVAEYQIVILSAEDSTGLDTWLKQEKYNIPEGAEPLLRPYVQSGMKFFVAKVDSKKVQFENGRATLSPLRFHYDSPEFNLPVRLGLINANGPQDLLIHILARSQRYNVANYPNVTIPTNLELKKNAKDEFGKFYVSLFDHTLEQNPRAVVTEYSWAASSCDPCPEPALTLEELVTLGADVLPAYADTLGKVSSQEGPAELDYSLSWSIPNEFVLTRLHARYDASSLGEDLVFQAAPPIVGGREFMQANNQLERGAVEQPGGYNNFQARYIIRHPWEGKIECEAPIRNRWGGPWDQGGGTPLKVAQQLAFEARDASLGSYVTPASAEIVGVAVVQDPAPTPEPDKPATEPSKAEPTETPAKGDAKANAKEPGGGCRCDAGEAPGGGLGATLLGLLMLVGVRRRRA